MKYSDVLNTTLSFLAYAILLGSAIAGVKYGILDSNAANLIIGGVLVHFGIYQPPGTTIVRTNGNGKPITGEEEKKP